MGNYLKFMNNKRWQLWFLCNLLACMCHACSRTGTSLCCARMQMMLDALWRALADCLRVRVMAWSLFPLLLLAVMAALFGLF